MLTRFNPFSPFNDFDRAIHLFHDSFPLSAPSAEAKPWSPAVDIHETENELFVKADIPDVKPEDLEVKFENGTLTLKGRREFEKKEETKGYHRLERSYGSFVRAFSLPETMDPEKVQADYTNGVLTVAIAKKEIAKPRTVKVNVKAN